MSARPPGDTWSPDQYARFRAERNAPFYDLLGLVRPRSGMRVVDLGCGPGDLTADMHVRLAAAETVGLDSSPAMLARAAEHGRDTLRFVEGDIAAWSERPARDLVFSNAALQWVPDHDRLIPAIASSVGPGGQLAVQMPANDDHASHVTAHEIAGEPPFADALGGYVRRSYVQDPETYCRLLDALGFAEQHVRVQIYLHRLPGREEVVEWVKGSLLTDYQRRLSPTVFEAFLARYRERLLPRLEATRPYLYPFKRVLFWGGRAA